jgi:hypothetical protein
MYIAHINTYISQIYTYRHQHLHDTPVHSKPQRTIVLIYHKTYTLEPHVQIPLVFRNEYTVVDESW